MSRLAGPGNPLRLQIFDAERIVAFGPRLDGNQVQNTAQPGRDLRAVARFNVRGENAAVVMEVVVQPVHAGINQANHVLRTARLGLALVLRRRKVRAPNRPVDGWAVFPSKSSWPRRACRWRCRNGPSRRKCGSICTTTIEPGGFGLCCETNGWSIQPPASCRRLGMEPSSLATGEAVLLFISRCPRVWRPCGCFIVPWTTNRWQRASCPASCSVDTI